MKGLKYKTRANSSPNKKPRVYFTCHPDDYESHFSEICHMILNKQNCTIWYDQEHILEETDYEDQEQLLSQMQLFVIPVTTRFLIKKSHARDIELPFAKKHHIPVLPLMMENGLDDLFAQYFGNIQYLSPISIDKTEISFDKKLETYLASVLIGDELAERIRSAFDAYIFLSYRKKDRKYAQQLMKLIHRIPACRDIAIWYDEFLIPGEDFNDAIAEALQKSDLFTLVVTPNLINEINYVLSTEYPMAKNSGKIIIPVEMAKTDSVQLKKKYENIPRCLPGKRDYNFVSGFLKAVRRLSLSEQNATPEHLFFIGLAYLDGIDVEVDMERALELIQMSADNGLVEAVEKLVAMYKNGIGVHVNYETAAMWQERLVAIQREGDDWYTLFDSLEELKSIYMELGREGRVIQSILDEMLSISEMLSETGESEALRRLSTVYKMLGNWACEGLTGLLTESKKKSREWFENALKIDQELMTSCSSRQNTFSLAQSYYFLEKYLESIQLLEALEAEEPTEPIRSMLISVKRGFCRQQARNKNYDAANQGYDELYNLCLQYMSEYNSLGLLHHIVDICTEQMEIQRICRDYTGMVCSCECMFIAKEAMANEYDIVSKWDDLASDYYWQYLECNAAKDLDVFRKWHLRAIEICQNLVSRVNSVESWRNLSSSYDHMAWFEIDCGNLQSAEYYYEKSLVLTEKVAEKDESRRSDLGFTYSELGELEVKLGQLDKAAEYYEKALSVYQKLESTEDMDTTRNALLLQYKKLIEEAKANNDLEKLYEYHSRLTALYEEQRQEC